MGDWSDYFEDFPEENLANVGNTIQITLFVMRKSSYLGEIKQIDERNCQHEIR